MCVDIKSLDSFINNIYEAINTSKDSVVGRSKLMPKNAIVVKLSFIFMDQFSNNYHTYLFANFIGKLEHQNTLVTQFLNTLTPHMDTPPKEF
jgi:hypothetical protein